MPWARNFCPFRAYWVISTVQVDPFPSREGNLKRKGRETSREKSSGRPQGRNPQRDLTRKILRETSGRPHERNPQRDLKGKILRETSRETSREKSSERPQGRNPQRDLTRKILRETSGRPHERNPQRDLKGKILRETSRETSREKSSERPQGRNPQRDLKGEKVPVEAAPKMERNKQQTNKRTNIKE